MTVTNQQTKGGNIKWSKNVSLTLTSLDNESFTIANFVVTAMRYTGNTADLVEVNDITDNKMDKDYVIGMRDGGTLDLTLQTVFAELKEGSRWTITASIDGVTIINGKTGIITQSQSVDAQGGQPASTALQFKILPSNSRLGSNGGSYVANPGGATGASS